MESFMLFQSIEAHERMQGKSDRQWIHTALALLKAYAEGTSLDLLYGVRNKDVYIQRLCDSVVEAASSLDNGAPVQSLLCNCTDLKQTSYWRMLLFYVLPRLHRLLVVLEIRMVTTSTLK